MPLSHPLGVLQPRLAVNRPGDEYEQEADRFAERALAEPTRLPGRGIPPQVQRIEHQPTGSLGAVPSSVDRALSSSGMHLEPALRKDMERRFGYDFSAVRVHSGPVAEQSTRDVDALGYTVGQHIVLGAGGFRPGTHEGRRLLAHELSHVVQQSATQEPPVRERPAQEGQSSIPLGRHSREPPHLQRQRTNQVCWSVTIQLPDRITFEGSDGPVKASVKVREALQPGTYTVSWDATKGQLFVHIAGGTLLSVSGRPRGTKEQRAAEEARFYAYMRSLTTPVTLTVIEATGGTGGGSGGSGTGATKKPPEVKGPAKGPETKGTGPKGTEPKGTEPKGTEPKGEKEHGGTEGAPPEGQAGSGTTSADYAAKLKALLGGGAEGKPLDEETSRRLKSILDKMSLDDIALYKQFAVTTGGDGEDMEGVLRSLELFMSTKSEYEKAPTDQPKTEVPEETAKILADAVKAYRDTMSQEEKERLARATIRSLSNEQLKNLSAKQIAEGIVRLDQQVKSMADDLDKGLDDAIRGTGWEKVAGGARMAKGAASFWGFLAVAAIIAASFVPGLNVAVLAAHAFAAGMVAFAAATIQEEAETKAAGHAKSAEDFQKRIVNATAARNQVILQGVVLALPLAGRLIAKLPLSGALNRIPTVLKTARDTLKAGSASAFASAKKSVLEALSSARADMAPYLVQLRASIGPIAMRIRRASGAEFLKEFKSSPELLGLVSADTLKAMERLTAGELAVAKKGVLEQLDNAPVLAADTISAMQGEMAQLERQVQAASTVQELQKVLGEGVKTVQPEQLAKRAGAQAVEGVVESRVRRMSSLSVDDVKTDTLSLMKDVQSLPNTNPNKQPVLSELQDILKKTHELEKKQGRADISAELDDLSRRHLELDDTVADAVAAVSQSRRPATPPSPKTPGSPSSKPGGQQPEELARGKLREAEVGKAYNLGPKNTQTMRSQDKTIADFIPDHVEGNPKTLQWGKRYHFKEIKDWADMSDTGNLSAMLDYVDKVNGTVTIYYKSNTYMSGPLKTRVEKLIGDGKVLLVPFASE